MVPFIQGLVLGLLLSINIGPVFLAITETSIKHGYRSGILVALGVSVSDIIYVSLILLGFSKIISDDQVRISFGLLGGLMLFIFGLRFFFIKDPKSNKKVTKNNLHGAIQFFMKGFVLNGLNPFVGVFWLGIFTLAIVEFDIADKEAYKFFAGVLLMVFSMDSLKSVLTGYTREYVKPRIKLIYKIMGLIFIIFGLRLIIGAAEIYYSY